MAFRYPEQPYCGNRSPLTNECTLGCGRWCYRTVTSRQKENEERQKQFREEKERELK
jgi:hypothetical protein